GIGSTIFGQFQTPAGADPSLNHALAIMLGALTLLGLGIFGPGIATGLVSGAPQLGAGAFGQQRRARCHLGVSRWCGRFRCQQRAVGRGRCRQRRAPWRAGRGSTCGRRGARRQGSCGFGDRCRAHGDHRPRRGRGPITPIQRAVRRLRASARLGATPAAQAAPRP
ncbi:hypothetical protein B1A_00298, partial [mine drainage metagenome]